MFKKFLYSILLSLVAVFVNLAQVPQLINYQGLLTESNGKSITGSHSIKFSIYESKSGGNPLWSETQTVAVTDGLFSLLLGSKKVIPQSVFNGSNRYLALQIDNDPEMTPRKHMSSVGYAFRAWDTDKVDGKDAAAFVQNVNGVSPTDGKINLVAGDNVTITPNNVQNKITISASGSGASDNLGNHTAIQNVKLNGHWLSGDGGNEGIFVGNNGNVGIGITTPGSRLEVTGGMSVSGAGIEGGQISLTDGDAKGAWEIDNYGESGNEELRFFRDRGYNNVFNVLVLKKSGNVGIGTGMPEGQLHVNTSNKYAGYFTSDGPGETHVLHAEYTGANTGNSVVVPVAVYGKSTPPGKLGYGGFFEGSLTGVLGIVFNSDYGIVAGVEGHAGGVSGNNHGVVGTAHGPKRNYGIFGTASGGTDNWAGYFIGDAMVTGTLSKGAGSFKIDHPLDPANKYLCHSFVESPDMMNIYNGNIILDANGEALVELPQWFEALNKDFRYQICAIGAPGPDLHIAEKIVNNRFKIAGGSAGMEVSWQVTGIRKDAYAESHRIAVEVEKEGDERGKYLHPQEFGISETLGLDYEESKKSAERRIQLNQERWDMEAELKRRVEGIK